MKSRWKSCLGLLAIFFTGLVLGVIVSTSAIQGWIKKLATADHRELESMVIEDWKKKLHLTDDQVTAIKPALSEAQQKIIPLRDKAKQEINAVLTDLHPKVKAVLNPKQKETYDEMVKKFEERIGQKSPK